MFAFLFTTLHAKMWVDNAWPYRSLPFSADWPKMVGHHANIGDSRPDFHVHSALQCACAVILAIQPTNRDRSQPTLLLASLILNLSQELPRSDPAPYWFAEQANFVRRRKRRKHIGLHQCRIIRPQHCLYFLPEPQGHASLRPTFVVVRW
jgi:hypothetical protein